MFLAILFIGLCVLVGAGFALYLFIATWVRGD